MPGLVCARMYNKVGPRKKKKQVYVCVLQFVYYRNKLCRHHCSQPFAPVETLSRLQQQQRQKKKKDKNTC